MAKVFAARVIAVVLPGADTAVLSLVVAGWAIEPAVGGHWLSGYGVVVCLVISLGHLAVQFVSVYRYSGVVEFGGFCQLVGHRR